MKLFRILLGVVWLPLLAVADCTLTNLNITPLPDRAYEFYKGLPGGLYPNFSNNPPPAHFAAGLDIAKNEIKPLDADGNADEANGKIVMTSIGMSNPLFDVGEIQFPVIGMTNYNLTVQKSEHLTDWISVATNRGPFTFIETNLVGSSRFYRAVLEP